jgi:hypothetical protein
MTSNPAQQARWKAKLVTGDFDATFKPKESHSARQIWYCRAQAVFGRQLRHGCDFVPLDRYGAIPDDAKLTSCDA